MDLKVPRVPAGGQPLDDPTLARSIPTFKHDDSGAAMHDVRDLDVLEPLLKRLQILVIVAMVFGAGLVIGKAEGHAATSARAPVPFRTRQRA